MANKKRSPRQQTKHDKEVKRISDYYKNLGFKVKADIKGEEKPNTIKNKRPDVFAKKGKEEIIVEVETKDSDDIDQKQQEIFQEHAKKSKNRRFRKSVV